MADTDDGPREPEDDGAVARERRHLLNVGYRLLGSLTEAEDAVQETYARWYALSEEQRRAIESPVAWLTTVASRICLDQLKSARARRERYVGEWIPEPLPPLGFDLAERVTLDESVNMALLVVLEAMTPAERVAFILHDVFRYPFADIATVVGRSAEACRQLATSARRRVERSGRTGAPSAKDTAIVDAFRRAWEAQDVAALVDLLDPDATVVADGGGLVNAARRPITGGPRLARYLANLASKRDELGLELVETTVNGRPGLAGRIAGETVVVLAVGIEGARIRNLWVVVNPEKLSAWNASTPSR
ncbi:RNA polymerase sigma factor SigJ [Actinomarinicola tropica]|uniref:Sigma-70 family RNA polymerase sigma factor n=1 Tax=Actinomarinicola tropica TaxID=2789776 RepID=A0A5Q2RK94_9ACTN|nr:RNA polymerase sigma factor SigJ [Actinomarinicola tropica]QGG94280.1 sigma-70 family RNA polymerase sigma factor [Actinomarinicola tropica]